MSTQSEEKGLRIAILHVGTVDMDATQSVRSGLCKAFPRTVCVVLEHVMPTPQGAYNKRRNQYNSSRILARMSDFGEDCEAERVLGVTDVDLYVPHLNFVFGEAECPGRFAIISLSRLRPEFFGQPPNRALFHERSVKEAVHEIGHTLGVRHCENPECIMFFSNSLLDTDRKESTFCERCHSLVMQRSSREQKLQKMLPHKTYELP
jgi:archaemetzincin